MHPRFAIEAFHLNLLRYLCAGPDKSHYILKGGCNLRFFFGSPRHSEDIDFDVVVTAPGTLRNKVNRLLGPGPLANALRSAGLVITQASSPKQTETTQRWKVQMTGEGIAAPLRTKIEFSRRGAARGHALEAVSPEVARRHRMVPPLVEHYLLDEAIGQKISALARRPEPQSRDVFDLAQLLARIDPGAGRPEGVGKRDSAEAIERALVIPYEDYASGVVAFLDQPEGGQGSPAEWGAMRGQVVDALRVWSS